MAGDGLVRSNDGGARATGTPPSSDPGVENSRTSSGSIRSRWPFGRRRASVRETAGAHPREARAVAASDPARDATPERDATPRRDATGARDADLQHDAATRRETTPAAGSQASSHSVQRPVVVPVPERPRLAPNVTLAGEMVESAFKTAPWLIDRDGRYIQVSRLLYVVAEQCDGQKSLEQIAEAVSHELKRDVGADDVKVIVGNLMKAAVVALPEGIEAPPADPSAVATGSPLALRMKMRMLSPKVIDPVTAVVQFLYWPPVLVVALGVAAVAQAWLYFSHGVGVAIHDAFYTPGLMLAVLGFIVIAAAFHELGHAAALRYGGAKARAMGVGLYIVYPAFYTDVTENYKLPRWARLRTDLGGFYFNLLFILGLLAIYRLTGLEFLILIVVILNLEIIHQTLPFVRLDGYWALADLTGIPDFFSQVVPFLRSHLPKWVPLPDGPKLAELKTWGKFAFATYIVVTIPLLIFLLFTMLRAAPRIVATAVDALFAQFGTIGTSIGDGNLLITLAAIAQVVALGLPLLGIVVTLFTLARRVFGAIWRWSSPTPARRVTGAAVSAALIALIAFMWAPQLPFVPGAPPGPLYAATAPFVPVQPHEQLTFSEITTSQGSLARPGVTAAPTQPGPSGAAGGNAVEPSPSPSTAASPAPSSSSSPSSSPGTTPGASTAPTRPPTPSATASPTPTSCPTPAASPPSACP
jgi:putative peptide zinc metalloprotease protein